MNSRAEKIIQKALVLKIHQVCVLVFWVHLETCSLSKLSLETEGYPERRGLVGFGVLPRDSRGNYQELKFFKPQQHSWDTDIESRKLRICLVWKMCITYLPPCVCGKASGKERWEQVKKHLLSKATCKWSQQK